MLPADRALLERIGARLREIRQHKGLTQEQVAEGAGYSAKYLGEIENGRRDVPLSTLRAVVEHGLSVQLESVFTGKVRRRPIKAAKGFPPDVEMTATQIASLPLKVRRPLAGLVKAIVDQTSSS